MPATEDILERVDALNDHDSERLLQAVLERLLADAGPLEVSDEESARELVAAFISHADTQYAADQVLRPSISLDVYVRSTLAMLAEDPATRAIVADTLDALAEETQMFADPVTIAVVLGVLIGFLQTKFQVKVKRKDGKTDFEFSAGKNAASDETITKVVDTVRGTVIR